MMMWWGLPLFPHHIGGGRMYYFGYMGLFPGLGMVLFWVLFIWLIVWLVRQNSSKDNPLDILRRRYAGGEISKKQYEQMKKEL